MLLGCESRKSTFIIIALYVCPANTLSVIEEMKRLVEKFPGGYEEYARNAI